MSSATTEQNQPSQGPTEHCYIEVGGDILSKPSSLSDLLEQQGFPTVIVFCNTPSDTDLLEVLLRKRGIAASKLIGYVPPQKLERTMGQLRNREISTIVVTDIAARNLNLGEFELVVNYSIQNDAELYLQRAGVSTGSASEQTTGGEDRPVRQPAKRVISLVGPLDLANFHFFKKAANLEFTKLDPPSKESILAARIQNLASRGLQAPISNDANYQSMAEQVIAHPNKNAILCLLLQNTLDRLPQLSSDLEKAVSERDALSQEDDVQPGAFRRGGHDEDSGRGQGGGRPQRGRGGRDRGGQRDDFQGQRSNRSFDDRPYEQPQFNDRQDRQGGDEPREDSRDFNAGPDRRGQDYQNGGRSDSGRNNRGRGGRNEGGFRRNNRDDQDRNRDDFPPRNLIRIKDDRLYIGLGANDGFTQEQFVGLLTNQCAVTPDQLKRFSLREKYSFADLPEEQSAKVLETLKEHEVGGKKLFITRAVTLTTTLEGPPDASSEGERHEGDDRGFEGNGDTPEGDSSGAEESFRE